MQPLILIKHSLPKIEENRPAREWRLSDEGRQRAERLAERLKHFHPEGIVCSTEPKAKETAEIIARAHQLEYQVTCDLHEHDRSNVPFLTPDQLGSSIHEFFQKPDLLAFGRETANQCHARFERAVHSVLHSYGNQRIAIVAHGTVISLYVSRLTGISAFTLWNELGLPAFVEIDLQGKALLTRENIV